jgi:hypothetical protein
MTPIYDYAQMSHQLIAGETIFVPYPPERNNLDRFRNRIVTGIRHHHKGKYRTQSLPDHLQIELVTEGAAWSTIQPEQPITVEPGSNLTDWESVNKGLLSPKREAFVPVSEGFSDEDFMQELAKCLRFHHFLARTQVYLLDMSAPGMVYIAPKRSVENEEVGKVLSIINIRPAPLPSTTPQTSAEPA